MSRIKKVIKTHLRRAGALALLVMVLLVSGCWDARPIERLALLVALGIDVNEENPNLLDFTFGHPLFQQDRKSGAKPVTVSAPTFSQATQTWQLQHDLQFASGRFRIILVSEEVARTRMTILLELFQFADFDHNASIAVVQGTASEFIRKSNLPETDRIGTHTVTVLETTEALGLALRRETDQIILQWAAPGIDPMAPTVIMSEGRDIVAVTGTALFQDVHMTGWLDQEMTRILLILRGERPTYFLSPGLGVTGELYGPFPEISLVRPKTSIKSEVVDGRLHVKLELRSPYIVRSAHSARDMIEGENIESLTTDLESNLALAILRLLAYLQETGTDPLGIGKKFRTRNFATYDDNKFREMWSEAAVDVQVNLRFFRTNSLTHTLFDRK